MIFFFMHADALAELVLKIVEDIVMMSFFMQYAICIFYIRSIVAWLSYSPLFLQQKMLLLLSFPFFFFFFFTIF
jgi:hypothetical protein